MTEHALALLEFERIRNELMEYCSGPHSERLLSSQTLLFEKAAVQSERGRTTALRRMFDSGKKFPELDCADCENPLKLLKKKGTVLDSVMFVAIARFIHSAGLLKQFLSAEETDAKIRDCALAIPVPVTLEREILTLFDREGNVQCKRVPLLNKIQEEIRQLRLGVEKLSSAYLNNPAMSGYFQTDVATIKDGRTVLPLKAQYKGRLKGIVHEVSGRGATLFLEPEDIVEKNNALVMQENLFRAELHKLLRELTEKAREVYDQLVVMVERVSYLDVVKARARYSVLHGCVPAIDSDDEIILREARHPLLGPGAVPISLSLHPDEHILLITGPNTGGKTVTLKTVGLFACMNQFGLEIPAKEGTTLPVFDNIFADIGDEQSITQSLSTFQAHMKNVASIVRRATQRSLVLLDELGAGTDPQEGTAIAMALLDHFAGHDIKTLATTHHGILKNYGYLKQGVVNASVEFDAERLLPTFRIIMGVPGESHALVIAGRNGMKHDIVEQARRYLSEERTDISRLVEELSAQKRELYERFEEQSEKEQETREKLRHVELKELGLRQRERELRELGLSDLKKFLADSRRDMERIVREIREGAHDTAIQEGRALIERLQGRIDAEDKIVRELDRILPREEGHALGVGSRVRIKTTGQEGIIVRVQKDGRLVVKTENLRVSMSAQELEHVSITVLPQVEISYASSIGTTIPAFELNVRGFRLAEAMRSLEKQLDAALVAGVKEFSILHGKGTGTLQQAIHEYLSRNPFIKDFHFALPEHGGSGKTIVTLK